MVGITAGLIFSLTALLLHLLTQVAWYGYQAGLDDKYISQHISKLKVFAGVLVSLLIVTEVSTKILLSNYEGSEKWWNIHFWTMCIFVITGISSLFINGKRSQYHRFFAWPAIVAGFPSIITGFIYYVTHLRYIPLDNLVIPALISAIISFYLGWTYLLK